MTLLLLEIEIMPLPERFRGNPAPLRRQCCMKQVQCRWLFSIFPPVAVLSVQTNAAIEAGVSGIGAAGLVGLVPSRAGAHGCGLQSHRHETHGPTVHHHGRVSHVQNIGATSGPGTAGTGALVHTDLEDDNLQERLELEVKGEDRKGDIRKCKRWRDVGIQWPRPCSYWVLFLN